MAEAFTTNVTSIRESDKVRNIAEGPTRSAGDSFAAAFERYQARIFAFVYSRVRDVELAKDIVSAVFEKAYRKGQSVRDEAAYGSWLFVIAKNEIAGHFRKSQREHNRLLRVGDELRFADHAPDPEESMLRDERVGQLVKHLRQLPQRDQELLSLKFDAELTNAEIARIVGMSPLNVRVAVFRALRRLRKLMAQPEQGASA